MKELITPFVEFPGVFITVSLITFLIFKRRIFLFLSVIFYILTAPVFWIPVQRFWTIKSNHVDAPIVVLGGGLLKVEGEIYPTTSTLMRLEKGFRLWNVLKRPIVVSGGGKYEISEAQVMKSILTSWGVPEDYVLIEDESMDTFQNAMKVREILDSTAVNLVTSALHTRRAVLSFEKFGFKVASIPTDYKLTDLRFESFLPQAETFEFLSSFSHEIVGYFYYAVWRCRYGKTPDTRSRWNVARQ